MPHKQRHALAAWLMYIIISSGSLAGPASARRSIKQHYVEALHSFLHRPFLRERRPGMPEHIHLQQQQMLDALHRQKHQDLHNMMHQKQQAAAGAGVGSSSTSGTVERANGSITDNDVLHAQRAKWPEGYVAVCAVVKDQNRDLRYWIEYHRWLGVEKFYIMDNNSTMPAMLVLWDYISSGIVDYQYFVGKPRTRPIFTDTNQYRAYQGCLLQHFRQHRWLAFIDIDEFFVLPPQPGLPLSAWQPAAANDSALQGTAPVQAQQQQQQQQQQLPGTAPAPAQQQEQLPAADAADTAAPGAAAAAAALSQQQPPERLLDSAAGSTTAELRSNAATTPQLHAISSSSSVSISNSSRAWGSRGRPSLALFLAGYENHAALGVNWVMFGSSGLQQRPPAGPLGSYNACVPQQDAENSHVKVIANTGGVLGLGMTPHEVLPRPGRKIVDVDGVPFKGPKTPHAKWHKLVIHHYVLKSREEFAGKHARGSGAGNVKGWEFFDYVDRISNSSCSWGQGISRAFFSSRPRLRPPRASHLCNLHRKQLAAAAAAAGAAEGLQESVDVGSGGAAQQPEQQQQQQQDEDVSDGGGGGGDAAAEVPEDSGTAAAGAGNAYAEQE